jgi:hypothetical protein
MEPLDRIISTHSVDSSPVIISVGPNDHVIAEPATPSISNRNNQSGSRSSQIIKPKFVIRGGRVQRTEDIMKAEQETSEPSLVPSSEPSMDEPSAEPVAETTEIPRCQKALHPPRKRIKHPIQVREDILADDEWSTEEEDDNSSPIQLGCALSEKLPETQEV